MTLNAAALTQEELNEAIRSSRDSRVEVTGCLGHRYIGAGLSGRRADITGTPGNALGAYLDGAVLHVHGNAQDAVGDTMNAGAIYVDGLAGDAAGYAMRGGRLFIHGSAGYRAGVHMKAYGGSKPLLVIGGSAGSFLGEYQAGGTIVVLGLGAGGRPPAGFFCGTGMYGGEIILRAARPPRVDEQHITCAMLDAEGIRRLRPVLEEFARVFGEDEQELYALPFYRLTPNAANPYRQMYTSV